MTRAEGSPLGPPDVRVGQLWCDVHGQIRIMAIAEGHAMARRKGCVPFVIELKDLRASWARVVVPSSACIHMHKTYVTEQDARCFDCGGRLLP